MARKRTTRKRVKRRGKKKLRITSNPVPNTKLVKLRYCDYYTVDPGAGSSLAGVIEFRANDMRDPDKTGVGHQPMGFDQWMTFYNHFRVIGSKITVKFFPDSSADIVAGIYLDDDVTSETSLVKLTEQKKCNWKTLVAGGTSTAKVSMNYSAKKFFGKVQAQQSPQMGSETASPSELSFFRVFAASPTAGTDPAVINAYVTIEYIALLTERRTLAQS